MSKKKTVAATAFLLFLLILAFLVPHFLGIQAEACRHRRPHPRPPPLSKTIVVTFQYADETPIVGLEVTLTDNEAEFPPVTLYTDEFGKVTFTGLEDETYTWHWYWQDVAYKHSEEITCTQIVWEFTETLDYWTLEKTFLYEETGTPVPNGLQVDLKDSTGTVIDTQYTSSGLVTFVDLKAGDYTVEWVWGAKLYSEPVSIGFADETPVVLENHVSLKSGGDI